MTKIYYVGAKGKQPNGETAFQELTGIVWRDGDAHEIDPRIASRMLQHPDVFSDKSPEERAAIEAQRRAQLEQQQAAAAQQQAAGGMAALLASLPPGTKITTPDGTTIEIPAGAAAASQAREVKAMRLATFTDPDNGDSNLADSGFGGADEPVRETQVGAVDTSAVSLAPGGTVAAAPAPVAPVAPSQAAVVANKPAAPAANGKAKR